MNVFNIDSNLDYMLKVMGKDIKINNIPARAIIQHTKYKDIEQKKIITKLPIRRGDLVNISDHNFMVVNEINDAKRDSYYKAYAESCNYSIKVNIDGELYEFPSIISTQELSINGTVISILNGKLQVTMQFNADTDKIKEGMRFIKLEKAWKITGIDLSKNGLIILNADMTDFVPGDDQVNEIANADTLNKYSIEANNIEIVKDKTTNINAKLLKNGVEVPNPTFNYIVENPAICSVENNVVTGIDYGNTTIIINYENKASKTIKIDVTVPQDNFVLSIIGDNTMYANREKTYSVQITNNGVDVSDNYAYNWNIVNKDGSTPLIAFIRDDTTNPPHGKSCNVISKDTLGFVVLTCTSIAYSNLTVSKEIEIIDLW